MINYVMCKQDIISDTHFRELKGLTNNAKIKSSLKFLFNIRYIEIINVFSYLLKRFSLYDQFEELGNLLQS